MKFYILALVLFLVVACNNKNDTKVDEENKLMGTSEETTMIKEPKATLRSQLEEKKNAFNKKADEKKIIAYEDGIKAVKESGVLEKAVNEGDRAPKFELPNATGESISLEDELKKGPVILTWYRGGWCPYCNMQLAAYQQKLDEFQKEGANLIAISPELPDKSLSTSEKNELKFEVLTDEGNEIANKYGIVFNLTEEVEKYYKSSFSFKDYYGSEKGELPMAVTYVIGQDGEVKWAYVDPDYRNRAETEDILTAVRSL